MNKQEFLSGLAMSMRLIVRDAVGSIATRLDEIDARVKAIPAGPVGPQGDKGERGEPGVSIKGDTGERGVTGMKGDAGQDGAVGPEGKYGDSGLLGAAGDKGLDGKDGRDGREGKDGRDGEPGRDALQIEILPMIDPAKSYARGTFAKHDGGLQRANCNTALGEFKQTEWDVITEGVADWEVVQGDDLRTFSFKLRITGNVARVKQFSIPVVIDRGICRAGDEYTRGDAVSWDGSMWICTAEYTKATPATAPSAWRLSVKHGRDGKNGSDGKGGAQGPTGPAGRDLTGFDPSTGKKW